MSFTDGRGFVETLTSAATSAVAEASSTSTRLWAGTMTVGTDLSGYGYDPDPPAAYGSLEDDYFTDQGTRYTVKFLSRTVVGGNLGILLDPLPGSGQIDTWTLTLDDGEEFAEFPLADASPTPIGTDTLYVWANTGLSWDDEEEVFVSLKQAVNVPAAGKPAVSGEAREDETLTADVSGITDENGIPQDASFTYQWIASDGGTDSDIDGADKQTYTLTSAEVGKTVKVRVGFTDGDGFAESVTSDPTGAVSGTDVFWSATITVKVDTSGFVVGYGTDFPDSTLTPSADFTRGSTDYTVTSIVFTGLHLVFIITPFTQDTLETVSTWTLVVDEDEEEFHLSDAQYNGLGNYEWSTTGLSWSDEEEVEVALKQVSEVNVAAAGAPAVTGAARVGELLTADVSGITDENGIPDDAAYSYQWVSSDGVTDTDLPGGTGPAYLLSDAEEGRTVRVRVGFTDSDGFEETPVSAATGPVAASSTVRVPWSANLTVGDYLQFLYGYDRGDFNYGQLEPSGFTHQSTAYTVTSLSHRIAGVDKDILLSVSPAPGTGRVATWTLVVGGREFALKNTGGTTAFRWNNPGLTWAEGEQIAVGVKVTNSGATGKPAVGGTAQVGETLTADPSGIADHNGVPADAAYSYQWIASDGTDEADIDGATGADYTLTGAEAGKTVRVRVGFTDADRFAESRRSDPTDAVTPPAAPNVAATGAAAVSGTAQAGELLRADTTGISDENGIPGDTFTYQWTVSDGGTDTDVPGADGPTYLPWDGDIGKTVKVRVSFTDSNGYAEGPLTSAATAAVTASPTGPVIWSATLTAGMDANIVGYRPSTSLGTLGALSDPAFTHRSNAHVVRSFNLVLSGGTRLLRFLVDPDPSAGAVDTWTLIAGDAEFDLSIAGTTIPVVRTLFNWDTPGLSWADGDKVSVGMRVRNLAATGAPTVGGTAQVGETLTADPSGISDRNGVPEDALAYQWVANDGTTDADIAGAAGPTYELTDSEKGKTIKVRVSFTDGDGFPEGPFTSDPTGPVAAVNYPATGAVEIDGVAQVGQTLTADTSGIMDGNGIPEDASALAYQWVANDGTTEADIAGAAGPAYTLTDSEKGKTIKVRVSFTDGDGFAEGPFTSDPTAPVAAVNYPATGAVALHGVAQVGRTLTADTSGIMDGNGIPEDAFIYEWRNDGGVIDGADGPTYRLELPDQGKVFDFRVFFIDGDGFQEGPFLSPTTAPIAPPVNHPATGAVAVTGTAQAGELLSADASGIADANGIPEDAFAYQWIVGDGGTDTEVPGADGPTYLPWDEDIGKTVKVRVSFTDEHGFDEGPFTSAATAAVTASPTGPVIWSATLTVGSDPGGLRLGLVPGIAGGALSDPDFDHRSTSYAVVVIRLLFGVVQTTLAFGVEPDLSTGARDTWTLIAGDSQFNPGLNLGFVGDVPTVVWSASSLSWSPGDKVSVGVRVQNRAAEGAPIVRGTAQVGETLTADPSGISDRNGVPDAAALTYQWVANDGTTDADVAGAAGPTYALTDSEKGKTIKVRVSFTDGDGFAEGPFTSDPTAPVAAVNYPATGAVEIDGVAQVGQTLTADTSSIQDGNGLGTFSYQWQRSNCADPADDGPIGGATGATYTVVADDLNCLISITVAYTDGDSFTETLTGLALDVSQAEWELSLSSGSVTEGDPDGVTATLRITNGVTFSAPVTVDLYHGAGKVDGGALGGQGGTHTITVPAESGQGSLVLTAQDNETRANAPGRYTAPLTARVGSTQLGEAVDLTVVDDEPIPQVRLAASRTQVTEGESFSVTATVDPPYCTAWSVTLGFDDPSGAVSGSVDRTLAFAECEEEVSVRVATDNDNAQESDAVVVFTLSGPTSPLTLGSPFSAQVTVRDNDGPPTAPANLSAAEGDGEVTLSWGPASSESSAIEHYSYRVSGDGGFSWNPDWEVITGSGPNPVGYTVLDLTNGNTYTFQVRARNATGEGAEASVTGRPFGAPGRPDVEVRARPEALAVNWVVPDDGGRETEEYQVQWQSGGQPFGTSQQRTTASPSDIIPGLENHTEYWVRVRARNERGWGLWSDPEEGTPTPRPPPSVTVAADAVDGVSGPFRVTIAFVDRDAEGNEYDVEGFEAGEVVGVYRDMGYSFELTEFRVETPGRVYSALVDTILDGLLLVYVQKEAARSSLDEQGNSYGSLFIEVDAPDRGPAPGGPELWSATLTVGDSAAAREQNPEQQGITGSLGYGTDFGNLSEDAFILDGVTYTVRELSYTPSWGLARLTMCPRLEGADGDFELHLGGGRWVSFDPGEVSRHDFSRETGDGELESCVRYDWNPIQLDWEEGESITVSITE